MSIAPGWYRDPADPDTQRWWDGEGWIGAPLPADTTPPPGPPPESGEPDGPRDTQPATSGPAGSGADPRAGAGGTGTGAGQPQPDRPAGAVAPAPTSGDSAGSDPGRGRPGEPPRPHGYRLATLGQRLIARLVDIGLVFALNALVNGWFVYEYVTEIAPVVRETWQRTLAGDGFGNLPETSDRSSELLIVILIIAAALWFAYEIPAVANNGQTPGKRLLGIKVVRLEQDQPLGFGRSFRRWNTMGLPVLLWWCFGIGFLLQLIDALFALFDRPLQQALHDKSAHTAVVATPTEPAKEAPDNAPADPT